MEKGVVSVVAEPATSGNASGVEFEFEGMTKGAMEDWVEKYKVGFFFLFFEGGAFRRILTTSSSFLFCFFLIWPGDYRL